MSFLSGLDLLTNYPPGFGHQILPVFLKGLPSPPFIIKKKEQKKLYMHRTPHMNNHRFSSQAVYVCQADWSVRLPSCQILNLQVEMCSLVDLETCFLTRSILLKVTLRSCRDLELLLCTRSRISPFPS